MISPVMISNTALAAIELCTPARSASMPAGRAPRGMSPQESMKTLITLPRYFGSTESNELGRVVLSNTTSAYKIGIDARVSEVVNNTRITGANLYMED